jgi:hypothetical protein
MWIAAPLAPTVCNVLIPYFWRSLYRQMCLLHTTVTCFISHKCWGCCQTATREGSMTLLELSWQAAVNPTVEQLHHQSPSPGRQSHNGNATYCILNTNTGMLQLDQWPTLRDIHTPY